MAFGKETREQVRQTCATLQGMALTRKINEWAYILGCNRATIYRWLAAGRKGRARRSDKGMIKVEVSQEAQKKMMAVTLKYGMCAEDVIEHAEANGWIRPGSISVSTYNRILRRNGIERSNTRSPGRVDRDLVQNRLKTIPHRRFEAAFSNQLHQIDFTEMPRYFVEADGSIGFESPLTLGRNKKGNSQPRLSLYVLLDDCSRATFARLYFGKNALNWIDFCMRSWEEKEDAATFPFCGRPQILYSDNDSAPKSGLFKEFLKDMDVEFTAHAVGNPKAKGKVERMIETLTDKLTAILRVYIDRGEQVTLEEANDILHDLLYKINYRVNSTTQEKPMLRWQSHMSGQVARLLPSAEILERYFYDSRLALIRGDLTLQFGGFIWQLPRREPFLSAVGRRVTVYFHRGESELKRILVEIEDREYTIKTHTPVPDEVGEHKALPKGRKVRLMEGLYDEDLEQFQAGRIYRERYAQLMLPAQKEAFDSARLEPPRRILTKVELKLRLKRDGVPFTPEAIDALYEDGEIFESEYWDIVDRLRSAG